MKIYTLTCHDVYNYGASLQAYALQKYLILQGHDAEIIDYKPDYLNTKYRLSWYVQTSSPHFRRCRGNRLFRAMYVLKRYILEHRTISRRLAFDQFTKKYLKLTTEYSNYIELCQNPPCGDIYIVGSDQVWNNDPLLNGWDAAFFLRFGTNNTRRISYAASFGSTKECPDIMQDWIKTLDAVSIREESSFSLLKDAGIIAEIVCDPVFLLSKEEWISNLTLRYAPQDYVLIYNLSGNNHTMIRQAKKLAAKRNLKIHYIATEHKLRGVQNIKGVGPKNFLEEILNAAYIFSDSFHATAFSLIFNKRFFAYSFKTERASQRIKGLLEQLQLPHLYNPSSIEILISEKSDYSDKLDGMISESKLWLNRNLI